MFEDVRAVFSRVANDRKGICAPIHERSAFLISHKLYALQLHLHKEARIMIDQFENVLDDGEHRLVIDEGRQMKMRMPDTDSFRMRIDAMRAHLDSYEPDDVRINTKECTVLVPVTTARAMHATALQTMSFVRDFFAEVQKTDYLRYLKKLKADGVAYAGPMCVQEVFNQYVTLHYLAAYLDKEARPDRLPVNWTRKPPSQNDAQKVAPGFTS
ncbi:MAG: hypothetical protein ACK4NR_04425 [Micavibrio sp.]